MGIEIIGKLTQKNNGNFKLVDLADVDYDGTGKSAKQELEKKIEEAKNSSTPYDDTKLKTDINTIKTDLGTEELTTTAKNVKGAVNEVAAQYKDITKQTITTEERNKLTNLENYDDTTVKTNIQNVQQQVNNLVLGAVGDGNNAEVVQARGGYDTLNDRSNAIEKQIDNFSIEGLGEEMTCFFENKSPNIINPNVKIYDNSQLKDGNILTNETWTSKVTDFVKLRSAKTIRTTTSETLEVALYDNSKTYISTADLNSSTPINLDSINNAAYIRIMIYRDLSTFMVYQSDTVIPIVQPYGDFSLKKAYLEEPVENIVKDKIYPIKPTDTNFVEYDITNYGLFVDIYENKKYDSTGYLVEDSSGNYNATSITKLDKNKNMYIGVRYLSYAVFFDANKNYISMLEIYYGTNIEKTSYPNNAEYVAFYYYKAGDSLIGDKFYVSTVDNNFNTKSYSTIKKIKNTRPIINIYTTDSEEQIFLKFCNAWYTGDCDVYFEYGIYNFDTIFELMKTKYSWSTAYELPIGSNCRYYFNNSTLIGTSTSADSNVTNNTSILGSHRLSGSYELYDGNLIANNIVYAVHDEASARKEPYIRKYHNMNMEYHKGNNTQYLSKCIGGGTGIHGKCTIDKCTFFTDNNAPDVSYHGHYEDDTESTFRLTITDSYFSKRVSLDQLGANEVGQVVYCNNSSSEEITPATDKWNVKSWCNEVRNS